MSGLNEFPSVIASPEDTPEKVLSEWGMSAFKIVGKKKYTHIFTHIRWEMLCVWVRTDFAPFDTYTLDEILDEISLPTAFKQCLRILGER